MDAVPPELVPGILKFLDLNDLRRAASVSRLFYASAWLSGLFILRRFNWYPDDDDNDAELVEFTCIVEHCLLKRLRLGLTVGFGSSGTSQTVMTAPSTTSAGVVLSLISKALPILDNLALAVPEWLIPRLASALCVPAPHLRELTLIVDRPQGETIPEVPVDILAGYAPQLRHVELRNIHLGRDALAAFSHVTSVHLAHRDRNPAADLALHFPRVHSLRLEFRKKRPAPPPVTYALDALRLRRLVIDEDNPLILLPAILRRNTLEEIPDVEYVCSTMQCGEPLWQRKADGPFGIHLSGSAARYEPGRVIVKPDHRRWRREFKMEGRQLRWKCPIASVPQLSERLSYLRMDNIFVVGLLECAGLSLDALRELQIDFSAWGPDAAMIWPPDWMDVRDDSSFLFGPEDVSTHTFERESYSYVSCSGLQTLVLFAVSKPLDANSQEVAFLGRALSQCQRHKQDMAVLELVGAKLKEPVAHTLLDQTFSAVRSGGLPGIDPHPGRDGAFWEEYL